MNRTFYFTGHSTGIILKSFFAGIAVLFSVAACSQISITVYFDFNKYELTDKTELELDNFLVQQKTGRTDLKLELHGHCDSIGADGYNLQLSKKRVTAVKNYLVAGGWAASRIVAAVGYGKRNPLNDNKTEEERQLNRRVELKIIPDGAGLSLKEKIADSSTVAGTSIVLRNINFAGGRDLFLPESQPMLNELLDAMRTYPTLIIRVEGHICCEPHAADGLDAGTGLNNLSEARAKAVMDYLVINSIAPERVSYKGFGHAAPLFLYPEKTEEERIANRRVEIKIIKK